MDNIVNNELRETSEGISFPDACGLLIFTLSVLAKQNKGKAYVTEKDLKDALKPQPEGSVFDATWNTKYLAHEILLKIKNPDELTSRGEGSLHPSREKLG